MPATTVTKATVIEAIKEVYDPEIPVDIYELGLIYEIHCDKLPIVDILMTLTSPSCPAAETIPAEVEEKIGALPGVEKVNVTITFDPPYDSERMSEAAKLALGFM